MAVGNMEQQFKRHNSLQAARSERGRAATAIRLHARVGAWARAQRREAEVSPTWFRAESAAVPLQVCALQSLL